MYEKAKTKHTRHILEYISDPENEFPTRTAMATEILNFSDQSYLYKIFSSQELTDIEEKGMEERKKRSSPQRAQVYNALLKAAKNGNTQAIKEFLDRTEGKVKEKMELTGKDGADLVPVINVRLSND